MFYRQFDKEHEMSRQEYIQQVEKRMLSEIPSGATHVDHLGHYWKQVDDVWRVFAHGIGWRYDGTAPAAAELINNQKGNE